MLLPVILHDLDLQEFRFYEDNCVFEGASVDLCLYKSIGEFSMSEQHKAHALALQFCQIGIPALITAGITRYRVWTEMDADVTPQPLWRMHPSIDYSNFDAA